MLVKDAPVILAPKNIQVKHSEDLKYLIPEPFLYAVQHLHKKNITTTNAGLNKCDCHDDVSGTLEIDFSTLTDANKAKIHLLVGRDSVDSFTLKKGKKLKIEFEVDREDEIPQVAHDIFNAICFFEQQPMTPELEALRTFEFAPHLSEGAKQFEIIKECPCALVKLLQKKKLFDGTKLNGKQLTQIAMVLDSCMGKKCPDSCTFEHGGMGFEDFMEGMTKNLLRGIGAELGLEDETEEFFNTIDIGGNREIYMEGDEVFNIRKYLQRNDVKGITHVPQSHEIFPR